MLKNNKGEQGRFPPVARVEYRSKQIRNKVDVDDERSENALMAVSVDIVGA